MLTGKAYGELDPNDPHNAVITDIKLAPRNATGKVEYTTTFQIVKPIDMSKSSRLLWHDVPNRGGRITLSAERMQGDIGLSSGWQGDAAGRTVPGPDNDYVVVPIAKNPDGSAIIGQVMGRIMNATGPASHRLFVASNPNPYRPASLDTKRATSSLTRRKRSTAGSATPSRFRAPTGPGRNVLPISRSQARPTLPRSASRAGSIRSYCIASPSPPRIRRCSVSASPRFATCRRSSRTRKPMMTAHRTRWQDRSSGSTCAVYRNRAISCAPLLQLGFTQDEANRKVYDGAWPIIAGRRVSMNARWAMPDGVLTLFEPGSEGPQWWAPWPDEARGLGTTSLLDRCMKTNTCPKIFEHFGSAEIWALKMSAGLVGTTADKDIPLPGNVRRYYFASSQHGGGRGGFSTDLLAPPSCPSTGYGTGALAANPMP